MSGTATTIVVVVLSVVVLLLISLLVVQWLKRRSGAKITIHSSIQHMRSIGQLSVFKVITKEIVTQMDHTWGEFGTRYLSWVVSGKKMAMIFEFEIDFRYDLRSSQFEIRETGEDAFVITLPPCFYEAHIRDIRFYDEQRSRFLPWLLPDLVNSFVAGGFSEADKNRLVDAARTHAEQQAIELINNLQSEVQNSAEATLRSISKAFGAENVAFEFRSQEKIDVQVDLAGTLKP